MTEEVHTLTGANFDAMTAQGIWAIDFWAEWCGPCKVMAPDFEKAAMEMKGKVKFGKVNVDHEMDIAGRFDVMSIPTMIILKKGEEAIRTVGALGKAKIIEEITSVAK